MLSAAVPERECSSLLSDFGFFRNEKKKDAMNKKQKLKKKYLLVVLGSYFPAGYHD